MLVLACTEGSEQLLAAADAGLSAAPGAMRARLQEVKGTVMVKRWNGDAWIPATEAMELNENDKVNTGSNGQTRVEFVSGGSIWLGEDASIAIAETDTRPGLDRTDVTVIHGRIDAELPDAKKQSLSVTTPSATVRAGREIIFQ